MSAETIAALVGAVVGAIVGAVLSILSEPLKASLYGPALEICFDPESLVDSHMTILTGERGNRVVQVPTFWTRIRVANVGRVAAHEVEVILREVWQRDEAGRFLRIARLSPLSLKWSNLGRPILDRIPAGIEKHCDFLHIPDPARGQAAGIADAAGPTAILEVEVHPAARPGLLEIGEYRAVLVATAANCRAVRRDVTFQVPPRWEADDTAMAQAVRLRGLTPRATALAD